MNPAPLPAPHTRAKYNASRRLFAAPGAVCELCGRLFERLPMYRTHCSQACARLDKQRRARGM